MRRLPDCIVTRVLTDQRGRATGVQFIHGGKIFEQKAKLMILSAFVVETPCLLFNSADNRFPEGVANSSGWVGKAFMPHSSYDVYGKFDEEIRLYKGTSVLATTQAFYRNESQHEFARGYTLHAHGSVTGSRQGPLWGEELKRIILGYNYYGRITMGRKPDQHRDGAGRSNGRLHQGKSPGCVSCKNDMLHHGQALTATAR